MIELSMNLYRSDGKDTSAAERREVERVLERAERYIDALRIHPGPMEQEIFKDWQDLKLFMSPFMLRGLCRAWLEASE